MKDLSSMAKQKITHDSLMELYNRMFAVYGHQDWWPSNSGWETAAGAVLTQNTSWQNVDKALRNLIQASALDPHEILAMEAEKLQRLIRPSGYYKMKTLKLKALAEWWIKNLDSSGNPQEKDFTRLRNSLLSIHGVGPETADCIMLYCFRRPSFVIDAYTRRVMNRHFGTPPDCPYETMRSLFMDNLPHDTRLFNEFHALFVQTGKMHCRKPECLPGCPGNCP